MKSYEKLDASWLRREMGGEHGEVVVEECERRMEGRIEEKHAVKQQDTVDVQW